MGQLFIPHVFMQVQGMKILLINTIFAFCNQWFDRYVLSLKGRLEIMIDMDATDAPICGVHQLTIFNDFYKQFMYNELFFHDGETEQIIRPVLFSGHSQYGV